MTYNTFETSNYDGVPVALYEFVAGDRAWRYTSARRDIQAVGVGVIWKSLAISDEGISFSGGSDEDEFTIRMPTSDFTDLFISTPPSGTIYVNVRRMHYGDTDAPVVWAGTLKSVKRLNTLSFQITCRAITSSLNRLGLRLNYSRNCPHTLYDLSCRVDAASFGRIVRVLSFTATTFTHNGNPTSTPDHYKGGFIQFLDAAGVRQNRAIESQLGNTLTLLTSTEGMEVNTQVLIYPGCDRTTTTCQNKFNNLSNFGGFPALPSKSPFDFDPIF